MLVSLFLAQVLALSVYVPLSVTLILYVSLPLPSSLSLSLSLASFLPPSLPSSLPPSPSPSPSLPPLSFSIPRFLPPSLSFSVPPFLPPSFSLSLSLPPSLPEMSLCGVDHDHIFLNYLVANCSYNCFHTRLMRISPFVLQKIIAIIREFFLIKPKMRDFPVDTYIFVPGVARTYWPQEGARCSVDLGTHKSEKIAAMLTSINIIPSLFHVALLCLFNGQV